MKFRFIRDEVWRVMLDAGKDVSDIAEKTGITPAAVTSAINGKSCPKLATIKRICDVLKVSPSAVCEAVEDEKHD